MAFVGSTCRNSIIVNKRGEDNNSYWTESTNSVQMRSNYTGYINIVLGTDNECTQYTMQSGDGNMLALNQVLKTDKSSSANLTKLCVCVCVCVCLCVCLCVCVCVCVCARAYALYQVIVVSVCVHFSKANKNQCRRDVLCKQQSPKSATISLKCTHDHTRTPCLERSQPGTATRQQNYVHACSHYKTTCIEVECALLYRVYTNCSHYTCVLLDMRWQKLCTLFWQLAQTETTTSLDMATQLTPLQP